MESHFISGLCVHDFFQCARKMRKLGAKRSQVKTKSIYPNIFNVANVMCFELKTQGKYIYNAVLIEKYSLFKFKAHPAYYQLVKLFTKIEIKENVAESY